VTIETVGLAGASARARSQREQNQKRVVERRREIEAKAQLIVEAALNWVATCEEDGKIAEEAEEALIDACESLLIARRGRKAARP